MFSACTDVTMYVISRLFQFPRKLSTLIKTFYIYIKVKKNVTWNLPKIKKRKCSIKKKWQGTQKDTKNSHSYHRPNQSKTLKSILKLFKNLKFTP